MSEHPLSLLTAFAITFTVSTAAAAAPAQAVAIPPPAPAVVLLSPTSPDPTPLVELYDGGGGLPNLGSSTSYEAGDWLNQLKGFHDQGVYATEIAAIDYLAALYVYYQTGSHLAIVLDVDETALSNYSAIVADNFTFGPNQQAQAANEIGAAIQPTLDLFNLARARGIAVFFVSERRNALRDHTISNLLREGYSSWAQLFLKSDDSIETTVQYKSNVRALIEQQGYHIIATVGDQYSDFAGGHSGLGFKLPNPFYFRP